MKKELFFSYSHISENKAEGHVFLPVCPQVSNSPLVNTFVSALHHSSPILLAPYPLYDCGIDSMEHPRACRQCCGQRRGITCGLAGCRRKWEGATGAGPLHPSDQRQAKRDVFCFCSLILVERLVQKLATDGLISIARMAFPFFSHPGKWSRTRAVKRNPFLAV